MELSAAHNSDAARTLGKTFRVFVFLTPSVIMALTCRTQLSSIVGMLMYTTCARASCWMAPDANGRVVIRTTNLSIPTDAFKDCETLQSITIHDNVVSIGAFAFQGTQLTDITLPVGINVIDTATFWLCSVLSAVTLPNALTRIGERVFQSCAQLTTINIPATVVEIDRYAFRDCTALVTLEVPSTVSVIGSYAFLGCASLQSFVLPSSLTVVMNNIFTGTVWQTVG